MQEKKDLKIISLNTWGGNLKDILSNFFEENKEVDIFCLQEVHDVDEEEIKNGNFEKQNLIDKEEWKSENFTLFSNLKDILINHNAYFKATYKNHFGLAIFIKKDFNIEKIDSFVVSEKNNNNGKKDFISIQYCTFKIGDKIINILNFHGLWTGTGKGDTEDRLNQSKNIINFIKTLEGEIILCGDFNLNPDTESIKILEDFGLINLIKENSILSTRTSYYKYDNKFADYTFVSKDIKVESFEIMKEEVSDHSAMRLNIKV